MPNSLVRHQHTDQFHFLTFSCYRRKPLLNNKRACVIFEQELESVRKRYEFVIAGYVVMPEHVHLLVSEPRVSTLAVALQVLKQQTSRRLKNPEATHFWQRRYYDFNVFTQAKSVEKLKYIHRNPVTRGIVDTPEQWPWSSFRHYATGETGVVEIESQWTARKRELVAKESFGDA
jgi:putative transposase